MRTGLFQRYISQSGTSLCLWAFVDPEDSVDNAMKLGKHLDCPTTNSKALVDCLKKVDISRLVNSDDIFGDKLYRFKTWGPTIEPKLRGAFLTEYVYYQVVAYGTHVHQSIIGHVADEGLMLTARKYFESAIICDQLLALLSFNINFFYTYY